MNSKIGCVRRCKNIIFLLRWPITFSAIGNVVTVVGMNAGNRASSRLGDERTVRQATQPSNSVE